jgi:2-polyprenyl-3-methyl-5-hydroxy-6-metoxy-1,4-benzoquinol methylase
MKDASVALSRQQREQAHYNKVAERAADRSLVMPESNIQRYRRPPADTVYPLEYAFHLLGDVEGKTVVDLGCGEGLNSVILASLGARVFSIDISDKSLEVTGKRAKANGVASNVTLLHSDATTIPMEDARADHVLCAAILHHVDPVATALEIARVLKPGGTAVFEEPLAGPSALQKFKAMLPKNKNNTDDERPLTLQEVDSVSRAVGVPGRSRVFGLTSRAVLRVVTPQSRLMPLIHQLDAALVAYAPLAHKFASPLVWEARKA